MNPYEIKATLSTLLRGQQIQRDNRTRTVYDRTYYKSGGELATELGRLIYSDTSVTSELVQAVEGVRIQGKYKQDYPQIAEVATDKDYTNRLAQAVAKGTKWKARPSEYGTEADNVSREVNKIIRKLRQELIKDPDEKKAQKYINKLSEYLDSESDKDEANREARRIADTANESKEQRVAQNRTRQNETVADKVDYLPPRIKMRVFNELKKLAKNRENQRKENTTKGRLQARRLGKYPTPFLFSKKEKPAPDLTVFVLIDLSGSMTRGHGAGCKLETVIQIKNELLAWNKTQKKVQFDIRGFNAQYYYADQIGNNEHHAKQLADTIQDNGDCMDLEENGETPMGWNSDGYFLRRTLKEMQDCRTRKALIILSDGRPAPYEYDRRHNVDLVEAVKELEKSRTPYMSIGIYTDSVKQYYKNSQVIMNLEELPWAIARTVAHFMK